MLSNWRLKLLFIGIVYTSGLLSNFVQITNQEQYKKTVLENSNPVVIKFAADWCSVCKSVEEPFQKIAHKPEFEKNITFAHIDIDAMDSISKQHSIVGVPTFVYMNQGKKVNEEIGINNMNTFEDNLCSTIRQTFHLAQAESANKQIQPTNQPSYTQEQPATPAAQPQGFFEQILAFIMQLFMQIKELFVRLFTAIRNLFGI